MTRFNISIDEGVEMVLHALKNTWGGEIFIPKIPSTESLILQKQLDQTVKSLSLESDLVRKYTKK